MPDLHLSTTLNGVLITVAAAAAVALTILAYRFTIPPVSRLLRTVLIILRTLGLFLLFLVLGEPLLSLVFHRTERPVLAVLVDQSKSMTIRDRGGDRKEILQNLIQSEPFQKLGSVADVTTGVFDTRMRMIDSFASDSLTFQADATNIGDAIRQVRSELEGRNLQAVLLVSDGNATTGPNSLAEAEELGVPVFTLGIGDTSMSKDLLLQKVLANTVAYVGTKVLVNATLRSSGFERERVEVALLEDGTLRDQKTVTLEPGIRQYDVPLSFVPSADGSRKITVEVSQLAGELSAQNNRSSVYVKVLKNKMRVLLFAGSPSADVASVRRAIQDDPNCTLKTFIERNSGQFYEGTPMAEDVNNAECFVLVGYPTSASSTALLRSLADQCSAGKGILTILSRTIDLQKLQQLQSVIPFVIPQRRGEEAHTFLSVVEAQRNSPILRSLPSAEVWSKLPPVFVPDEPLKAKPESEILAFGRIQALSTTEPLLMLRRVNRTKSISLACYGFWRWGTYADGIPGAERLLENLMRNSIRWLVTTEDEKPVQVRPVKEIFAGTEPVEFTAQVYDENYLPLQEAEVFLSVERGGQTSQLTLSSLGNGRFEGSFDPLPEGDYTYVASAFAAGDELAKQQGSFSVGGLNAEYMDTRMNRHLLQQIAARTGGKYYDPQDLSRLQRDVSALTDFRPRVVSIAHETELWNVRWMMALMIAFFSMEWFLRKRNGML